ncbi:3-carboxy-cis,cis-muconate cycloisomerase [Spirosoma pollinicola]|uniref:3-carboxy-cis,cis-muconate cycloisomerase n=1 Tax=Spirosoma pollinicola TaxID=2057025 RepID=A0A2K8YZL4_9BACT|nr:3-carboxy-cis,cis-muconate cycloisomerase [Spirosoma pollinicola]AUD03041.1 3-carboxy-cis,cis-muconate cycloisomerase [Spirosoma pollinicola]
MSLYRTLFYQPDVNALYSDEATVAYMLWAESALARAQALHGLIPGWAADAIAASCNSQLIDINQLVNTIPLGANACIPLVKQLTTLVEKQSPEASPYIHFGATSQDIIDTATMLQSRDAVLFIQKDLHRLIAQLTALAVEHDQTPMVGRTLLQQAKPITFGFKVRTWLDGLGRSSSRLENLFSETFALQLGGAVGDLKSMGSAGPAIAQTMADDLGLYNPTMAWHTQRDRIADIAAKLGILVGAVAKIATDISLMMQTEVGEVLEPAGAGKGGSSAMPHKRNPVSSVAIRAIAGRTPNLVATLFGCLMQDHERASGAWHAEWEPLAELIQLTAGAVHQAVVMTDGLVVNVEQMRKNLDATNGLLFAENVALALAPKIGKSQATAFIETACWESQQAGQHLNVYLSNQPLIQQHFTPGELATLFDPTR